MSFLALSEKRVAGALARVSVAGLSLVLGAAAMPACADQKVASQPPQQVQLARAIATPEGTEPPEPLSPAARSILKDRMSSHVREMGELVSAIMVLRYPEIAQRADSVAADVNLSRPLSSDATELNSSLPEKFFVRQDELRVAARGLGVAARAGNPYQVADAYGRMSEACVRCHADYRPRNQGSNQK